MLKRNENFVVGTAKNMFRIWKECNFLNHDTFPRLHSRVDSVQVLFSDVGKLPTKLESRFDDFTADELKKLDNFVFNVCLKTYFTQ